MKRGATRSNGVSGSGTDPFGDDPTILWCRLPGWTFRVTLLPVLALGALFMLTMLLWLVPGIDPVVPATILFFLVLIVLLFFGIGLWSRRASMAPFAGINWHPLEPIERILIDQEKATPRFGAGNEDLWSWEALAERCRREDVVMPRTLIHKALKDRLQWYETPADFLEPEPIHQSSDMPYGPTLFFCGFWLFIAFTQFRMGHPIFAAFAAAIGLGTACGIPAVRDRVRKLWDSGGHLVAGQGWLRDRRGRLFTTEDSLVVVREDTQSSTLKWMVTGRAGVMTLSFINENDPEFDKLWQRWNHPDPRPELANHADG